MIVADVNPDFDSRLLAGGTTHFNGGYVPLRGRIVRLAQGTDKAVAFQFLYNPTLVNEQISVNTQYLPKYALDRIGLENGGTQGDTGANLGRAAFAAGVSSGVMSFSIFVDRMYEVATSAASGIPSGGGTSTRGVAVDVDQMKKVLGYTDDNPIAQTYPVYVTFGGPQSWYGYINHFDVRWLIWSARMVPTRAVLENVSLQVIPRPTNADGSTTSSTVLAQGGRDALATPPVLYPLYDNVQRAGTVPSADDALRGLLSGTGTGAVNRRTPYGALP